MKLLFSVAASLLFFAATAQPRFTDSTFGSNGKIIQNTSLPIQHVTDVVLQPDGKSVTLAEAEYNTITRIVLIRYNTNGTLDASFSGNGIADSLISLDSNCHPLSIKVQSDSKLLVGGFIEGPYVQGSTNLGIVLRYNTNGSLDASFGNNGLLYLPDFIVNSSTISIGGISDMVVLPNNKIMLLAGSNNTDDLILIRLNTNGSIDSSFGTNGIVNIDTYSSYVGYYKLLLQSDGKMIAGGSTYYSPGVILTRVNANGTLDASYGTSGSTTFSAGPAFSNSFRDMALQADNKVIISGIGLSDQNVYQYAFAARVATNGALDASYATNGVQYVLRSNTGFVSSEGQVSLQQDGKALLAGSIVDNYGFSKMAVARLTTAGIPDATFDGDGIAVLQINQHGSFGVASAQQTNGNIIVSGYANNNDAASAAIARLTASGQTDNTVATAANIAYIGSGQQYEAGLNVHIQPADQKIVDLKERFNGVNDDLRVSRYLSNGTPDATFGTGGHTVIEMPGSAYQVHSTLLSNGKLLIATLWSEYLTGYYVQLIRVNTNGFVDSSFGLNGRLLLMNGSIHGLLDNLKGVAFQPNDKIVLLTSQFDPVAFMDSTFILRLNADGSPDVTFNGTGRKYLPYLSSTSYETLAGQADGKIVLAERRTIGNGSAIVLSRYNTDGSLDNTYNTSNTSLPVYNIDQIKVQPDNKVVLTTYGNGANNIYRFSSTGTLDNSFGLSGKVSLDFILTDFNLQGGIYLQDSGKILITGSGGIYPANSAQIVKLLSNGRPDSAFGVNGILQVDAVSGVFYNEPILAKQADGRLLLTGIFYSDTTTTSYGDAILTRLKNGLSTGRLYTFTGSGLWSNPANWSDGTVPPTTILAGSSIVIDPPTGSECVIDITVHVQAGATVTLRAGKTVRLPGNLIIQ